MIKNSGVSYKSTIAACYIGNITMAVVINILPILFVPLQEQYGISYAHFGQLILVNFVTQVSFDIVFSFMIDKFGFRIFIVASPMLTVVGMLIFIFAPNISPGNPYPIFILGTMIFSGSCGLLELLLSPIVNAIPTDEKSTAMSMLHSFYSWGQILVIVLTTLSLFVFGRDKWQYIMFGWLLLPIIDFFMFIKVPLAPPIPEEKRQSLRAIDGKPLLALFFFAILFGGASEACMSQWSSVFAEKALGISKVFGDLLGVTMFAFAMGIGRLLYGKFGSKMNMTKILAIGSFSAMICYLVVALSGNGVFVLAACALTGISVSLLWPGTLVVATEKFPFAGAWIFALLAAGGDLGCSIGPWVMGKVVDGIMASGNSVVMSQKYGVSVEQLGLKAGFLVAAVFPLIALIVVLVISKSKSHKLEIKK